MNTKLIYALIGGGIGALVGGLAIYFIEEHRYKINEQIAGQTNDVMTEELISEVNEVASLQKQLEDERFKTAQLLEALDIFCNKNDRDNVRDLVNTRIAVRSMQQQGFDEETITDTMIRHKYADILSECGYAQNQESHDKPEPPENSYERDFDEAMDKIEEIVRRDVAPYLITEEEYITNDDEYRHEVLTYYALDDTLADEDDDIFDQSIVGEDNLMEFERTDCPSIFIRNEHRGIEYEIIWEDAISYHAACLGISNDESLLIQRIFRREEE